MILSLPDQCATMKCPEECHNFPTGSICTCAKGFEYNNRTNTCDDIDECASVYGVCSQTCVNTVGSYKCSCVSRFQLNYDGRSCDPIGRAVLVFSARQKVYSYSIEEKTQNSVAVNLSNAMGVNFDGRYVYWTDISRNMVSLEQSYEDQTHREIWIMMGLIAPEDLAVDWLTGNFYFTDSFMQHIGACSSDGYNCAALVSQSIEKPRGIVLYPQEGQMFWTDWGKTPMIVRASMDGSDVIPIVTEDLHSPNGLCLDWPNDRLYWVDTRMKTIESINLKNNKRHVKDFDAPSDFTENNFIFCLPFSVNFE